MGNARVFLGPGCLKRQEREKEKEQIAASFPFGEVVLWKPPQTRSFQRSSKVPEADCLKMILPALKQ